VEPCRCATFGLGIISSLPQLLVVSPAFWDEKDRLIRPLGRARGDGPGLRFGFRNGVFPSWFLSRWRLSPLFSQDAQNLFFPAPISCLGERHFPASGDHLRGAILGSVSIAVTLLGIRATSSPESGPHYSKNGVTARSSNCAILATNTPVTLTLAGIWLATYMDAS
jgi:hypothetical protein